MASKKEVTIVGNVVTYIMNVKRDSFSPEHEIKCEVNIEGMDRDTIIKYAFSGQTLRVKHQSQIRSKPETEIARLAVSGIKCSWKDIDDGSTVSLGDRLMKLTKEQFVELMMTDLMLEEEDAIDLYNRKHGINQ